MSTLTPGIRPYARCHAKKPELIDRLVDATNADEAPCIKTGVHPLRIRPRDSEKTIEMAAKRFKQDQAKSDAIRAENEPPSLDEITKILSERRARVAQAPRPLQSLRRRSGCGTGVAFSSIACMHPLGPPRARRQTIQMIVVR